MNSEKSRRFKIPHVFVLLTVIIFFCSLLSYMLPSGIYQRETINIEGSSRTVVIPGTYSKLTKHISLKGIFFGESTDQGASPVSLLSFLTAIPRGMAEVKDVPNIIFMLFIIGGVLGIFQRTGTITAAIQTLFERFSNSGPFLTISLMVAVGIGGSTFGMGEELIPLVPIFLLVFYRLGYDRIYGMSIVYLGALVGFAAATTNPFTVQIAQGIAEVPPGSGILFRIVFFVVIMSVTIGYVLMYGRRIKKDPSKMIIPNDDPSMAEIRMEKQPLKVSHILILSSSAIIFFYTVYAFQKK
jgi:uncharacterized ion transporter superfamily protein YfcC